MVIKKKNNAKLISAPFLNSLIAHPRRVRRISTETINFQSPILAGEISGNDKSKLKLMGTINLYRYNPNMATAPVSCVSESLAYIKALSDTEGGAAENMSELFKIECRMRRKMMVGIIIH